jgi:DNA-binding Lrp family transcriptional regulator
MSDIEFDVLDELYFVASFSELQKRLTISELPLKQILQDLLYKGWIKCFEPNREEVITKEELDFDKNYQQYHYLATKEGLKAHNTL